MSETKEYFEILGELINKLKKLTTWNRGNIKELKVTIGCLIDDTENEILDRNNYELYLDEERARKQEEYNTWKDENKEQVES